MKTNHLLTNARTYKKASLRLGEAKPNNDGTFEMFIIPATVLLSFSVELYLKYILFNEGESKNGKPLMGHDLYCLYSKLKQKSKDHLINRFKAEHTSDFNEYIKNHSEIFVKWRYNHEYTGKQLGTINPSFLFGLIDAMEFIILVNNYEN